MSLEGWIFLVGLRVFDTGALIWWLIWFSRATKSDDDGLPGDGGRGNLPPVPTPPAPVAPAPLRTGALPRPHVTAGPQRSRRPRPGQPVRPGRHRIGSVTDCRDHDGSVYRLTIRPAAPGARSRRITSGVRDFMRRGPSREIG